MPRIVCSRLQEPYKQRAACASVPASYIRSVTMTAVLKFEVPYGAIKFQNFKAGWAKPSGREILETGLNEIFKASLDEILGTRFNEILKASPGTNFKSGALGCAKILKPRLQG